MGRAWGTHSEVELSSDSVVENLEEIKGVTVHRSETASERHDDMAFIDLTAKRDSASSNILEILREAGFHVSALKAPERGKLVIQAKG